MPPADALVWHPTRPGRAADGPSAATSSGSPQQPLGGALAKPCQAIHAWDLLQALTCAHVLQMDRPAPQICCRDMGCTAHHLVMPVGDLCSSTTVHTPNVQRLLMHAPRCRSARCLGAAMYHDKGRGVRTSTVPIGRGACGVPSAPTPHGVPAPPPARRPSFHALGLMHPHKYRMSFPSPTRLETRVGIASDLLVSWPRRPVAVIPRLSARHST